ncbi:hypothetical protein K2173_002898 [Erythroxylum novogranatense]|uniref:Smr domain-containing protein n=1 Tax=Erythroxylum novogranatense TaxID=1862640 RepID=A0AAV8SQ69_9ROSI|nr:hypothetical protein K2173_002898 [Erythroxylum novogranatense]
MAASLSTLLDVHFLVPQADTKRNPFITIRQKPNNRRLNITCNSSKSSSDQSQTLFESPNPNSPSLSDQLKPLSSTTLSTTNDPHAQLLSKPKSIWINPTKPRRYVLSLQRQKRSHFSHNPDVRDFKRFARKLNDSDYSESSFMSVLEQIPYPVTRENALFILNSLKPWQKTHLFFKWIKTHKLFPLETIFYNITMKSLRFGRQFELIEELANEMVSNEIELDNITYSTIITCAKRCNKFNKAVEWFERMYKTGLMPDEVTYSAILDVYGKLGKVEEALTLYERGIASGWKPDPVTYSILAKMFGESGDYDGVRYVLQEMKALGVQPNVIVYNTLIEATGKAGKPGMARSLFEEMLDSGFTPDEKTLTAVVKVYGKARWSKDAMELWEKMRSNKWPMDFILYNTLLNMCADLGLEEEAERLFEDMKGSEHCRPDSWSYTAMLNIYGSGGKADKAMLLFDEMSERAIDLNVMGCTCLIQCLGKAKRIDDLVRVFDLSVNKGVKPDDRLCGSLLSVVSLCEQISDASKVLSCLQKANSKLVALVKLVEEEQTNFETLKSEFRDVIRNTVVDARRPFCNCLIDICRSRNLHGRAHELLYLGTFYGLYPDLHHRTADEWSLDVRSLSVGAANTALEEWLGTLAKFVQRNEALPELFSAHTGAGTHKFSQGLANAFASHVKGLAAPFRHSENRAGSFVANREDLVDWVQSRIPSAVSP